MQNRQLFVAIAGGLGNQLFQITTGMSLSNGKIVAISCLGNPRSTQGKPDAAYLKFPERVEFFNCQRRHYISKRVFSLLLSMAVTRNKLNQVAFTRLIIYLISSLILSFHTRALLFPRVGNGTGHDLTLKRKSGNFLVGYFQTHVYLEESLNVDEIHKISILNETPYLNKLELESADKKIMMIHIRLGDYINELDFGVLGANYYQEAITKLESENEGIEYWLFSDEPAQAMTLLPKRIVNDVYTVNVENVTAAETFEIMRKCSYYVIANSTLSWWGAYLSHNTKAVVISPEPWFQRGPSPERLIPNNWYPCKRY